MTENARIGLVIIGADRRYVYANATYADILDLPSADLVGQRIADVLPDVYDSQIRPRLDRAFAGDRISYELKKVTAEGDRHYAVRYEPTPIGDTIGMVVVVITDISDRFRAEEERRLQQAMLWTERELTLDGILVVDQDSRILSYNGRFAQMWGVSAELLSTKADDLLLTSVAAKLRNPGQFMKRIRELYHQHDEHSRDEVELADGRVFDRYSAPMRHADGQYYGRIWYFRDVTERKQAEAELRAERDRAERYLNTAEVILLALDTSGTITVINRKGCDILGWTEAELVGQDWSQRCLPERLRPGFMTTFNNLSGHDFPVVESPVLTRSGEERLIEWRNRVLRDETGAVIGTFSSGSDITERHEAEEALRAAEERMRFALENSGAGIWDMDYTTGVVRMSETCETHYGLPRGTFVGTFDGFIAAVHPDDRREVLETIEQAIATGRDFSIRHRTLWPDGTVRWLSNAGRVHLNERGEPERGVGISLDITDRRLLEDQYHQAQKMEAVGRLAGGVAHDFNNLLTAILGYCQLLLIECAPDDPRRPDIMEIYNAGESASRLTRQLLAFSRKQIIEATRLDLNEVIGNMRGMLDRLIGEDVRVMLKLAPELGPVSADSGQIEQIVLNLAVNARDAMPEGGVLTIETRPLDLDASSLPAPTVKSPRGLMSR